MGYSPFYPMNYNFYPTNMQYQQPQQPNYTQPTIRAEIVQISGDREEAENYPVPTGGTQMMINKAEDKIFIKTVYANNQSNLDIFVKQAPTPTRELPNFDEFVTWDKLEQRLAQIMRSNKEDVINEQYVPEIRQANPTVPEST